MKKFSPDAPDYSVFDMSLRSTDLDFAMPMGASVGLRRPAPSVVWEAALARKSARAAKTRDGIYRQFFKRAFDLTLIAVSLPIVVPLVALFALALWLEGGAAFYTQRRIGRHGKTFSILKLRTMVRDADTVLETYLAADPALRQEWDSMQKLKSDPRVTPVGRLLRATSLDELPQLFNVLLGDMSLIGPRPMMLNQATLYGDKRAYEALRPGITGLWQISTRNNSRFAYRNEVDAAYERSLTFGTDLTILIRTVGVVLRRTGY
ncbi:Sugar transferase involved in LPS biosynthesis (colanic, teichoic acid) [Sulfitobacter brevis]|uniref:Sugar transferase involved in LPS biosynthesis (Colanic, teichoic acid) n=1 Tax=Sulfitobacter brevis TaxID=74348 RepID=A0A1I2ALM9_9RHOB|nr:sugar transferase [Sulfitobacter brevis]SFE44812.1 Sugar transferase involved in LPS biosynthesis (colanic, teichoic acid) [Sulfitobacter brevis]